MEMESQNEPGKEIVAMLNKVVEFNDIAKQLKATLRKQHSSIKERSDGILKDSKRKP
jgi:hypothetical protein